jgi:hypothetical protein
VKLLPFLLATLAACAVQPTERVNLPTAPRPGPWQLMRDTLLACSAQAGLAGPIEARVSFDDDGVVSSVGSGYGDPFARCVGDALVHTRFGAERGRTLLIAYTAGPVSY